MKIFPLVCKMYNLRYEKSFDKAKWWVEAGALYIVKI